METKTRGKREYAIFTRAYGSDNSWLLETTPYHEWSELRIIDNRPPMLFTLKQAIALCRSMRKDIIGFSSRVYGYCRIDERR